MAIIISHQPPGPIGMAAYIAGRGKAREREQKYALGLYQQLMNVRARQQEQLQGFGYRAALENIQQRGMSERAEEQRDFWATEAEKRRTFEVGQTELEMAGREKAAGEKGELDYAKDLEAQTAARIDEIRKASGGMFSNDITSNKWKKMEERLRAVDEDEEKFGRLTPTQRLQEKAKIRGEFLKSYDPQRDITPLERQPGAEYIKGYFKYRTPVDPNEPPIPMDFASPEAAREWYESSPKTPGGDAIAFDYARHKPMVLPGGQSQEPTAYERATRQAEMDKLVWEQLAREFTEDVVAVEMAKDKPNERILKRKAELEKRYSFEDIKTMPTSGAVGSSRAPTGWQNPSRETVTPVGPEDPYRTFTERMAGRGQPAAGVAATGPTENVPGIPAGWEPNAQVPQEVQQPAVLPGMEVPNAQGRTAAEEEEFWKRRREMGRQRKLAKYLQFPQEGGEPTQAGQGQPTAGVGGSLSPKQLVQRRAQQRANDRASERGEKIPYPEVGEEREPEVKKVISPDGNWEWNGTKWVRSGGF